MGSSAGLVTLSGISPVNLRNLQFLLSKLPCGVLTKYDRSGTFFTTVNFFAPGATFVIWL